MRFRELLYKKQKILSVEYNPPKGININTDKLKDVASLIDAVNVTDCPMSNLRMNSVSASSIIKNKTNIEPIFNLTCRDRNVLALSSDLLGAWALGIENILAINGDAFIDDSFKENVYKVNTYGLLNIINNLNKGTDYRNNSIKGKTDFFTGAASNIPKKINIKGIANRLKKKEEYGVKFVITQPVYSIESLEYFLEASKDTSLFKIIGFFVPPNLKVANYLNNSVKGIDIPAELIKHFKDSENEKIAGFEFVEDLINDIAAGGYLKYIDGVHLMNFNKHFVENVFKTVKGEKVQYEY